MAFTAPQGAFTATSTAGFTAPPGSIDPTLQGVIAGGIATSTGSASAGVAGADAASQIGNIFADLPGAMIRIGLFLAALLLIIVGFWVVSQ